MILCLSNLMCVHTKLRIEMYWLDPTRWDGQHSDRAQAVFKTDLKTVRVLISRGSIGRIWQIQVV